MRCGGGVFVPGESYSMSGRLKISVVCGVVCSMVWFMLVSRV